MHSFECETGPFFNLLREIVQKIGGIDANIIKNNFKNVIESKRTFSKINTIASLLQVLLERDAFWEENVETLEHVVKNVGRTQERYTHNCKDLLEQIGLYKKLNETSATCTICQVPINFDLPDIPVLNVPSHQASPCAPPIQSAEEEDEEHDFNELSLFLGNHLGRNWRKLGIALGLDLYEIDSVEDEYKTLSDKVCAMLLRWREKKDPNINTKKTLVKALNSKYVLRRDLASKIDKGRY